MDRAHKERAVTSLHEDLLGAGMVVVAHYRGLTVAESTDLRRRMRAVGARFRVTKNRLARIALKGTTFEPLDDLFKGPTAVAYAADAVAVSKAATEYAKGNDKFRIIGGCLGAQLLDAAGVEALTKLPSIDELRAKLLGMINTPATRIAGILPRPAQDIVGITTAPAGQLARVLMAYATKDDAA